MSIITTTIIAFSLAMDAFAVSISTGAVYRGKKIGITLKMATAFGVFQGGMILLGALIGETLSNKLTYFAVWIAVGVLCAIGINMVVSAFKENSDKDSSNTSLKFGTIIILALATSIDALVVGVGLALVGINIILAAIITVSVTFALSVLGVLAGKWIGKKIGKKAEIIGGLVLVIIGIKLLFENVFV